MQKKKVIFFCIKLGRFKEGLLFAYKVLLLEPPTNYWVIRKSYDVFFKTKMHHDFSKTPIISLHFFFLAPVSKVWMECCPSEVNLLMWKQIWMMVRASCSTNSISPLVSISLGLVYRADDNPDFKTFEFHPIFTQG